MVESGAFRKDLDVKAASQALAGMVMDLILLYGVEYEQGGMEEQWSRVSGAIAGMALEGLKAGSGSGPGCPLPSAEGEGGTG